MTHAAAAVTFDLARLDRDQISADSVAAALQLVDLANIVDTIAGWREHDTANRRAGGRPAVISDRAALAIFTLLACSHRPLHVRQGAIMLAHQLDPAGFALLGITPPVGGSGGEDDWYQRLWRAIHRVLDVIDPYPAPRNRRLTSDEAEEIKAARDPADQAIRKLRLDWVCNRLIEATWQLLPRRERRQASRTNICIDATPVRAHARGRSDGEPTLEPDAAWYVRTGDHADTGRSSDRHKFGWEAHLAVACTSDPGRPATLPLMVTGISFDKPGHRIAENAMTILASMNERGYQPGLVATDRAYWPNSQTDKLQLPARALGWKNINDYKETELGIKDGHKGGIQVEGAWYCPSMPQHLVNATIDFRARRIDEQTWQQRIDDRARYMLKPKENPDADGKQPLRCPAIGPSATVACPLRPTSMTPIAKVALRASVSAPPEHPDEICTQTSVTFPTTVGAKYRQDHQFGSQQWARWYKTMRSTIEGFNGYVKDAAYEDLETPGRRRLRGRAAQHLLVTLLVVSANRRKLRMWIDHQANPTKVTQIAARRDTRRARQSLKSFLPDAHAPPGTPPTATA